jgi:hypothetical protein
MRTKLLLVCVLAVSAICHAQKASIKKIELAGEKIIVHYDLEDSNPVNEYQIQLYSSQSNFATALTRVSGDVGNEIKPGSDKKIEWKVREEIGPYRGRISLEIRGRVFMAVAKINSIGAGDKFKRGKSHLINWRPGNSNPVNVELLKDGNPVTSQLNQPNSGALNLFIPQHSKVGNEYTIRITDTKNSGDFVISQPFTVTRKVPLLLKALPVVAVGAAILFLGGDDATPDGIPGPPELPD